MHAESASEGLHMERGLEISPQLADYSNFDDVVTAFARPADKYITAYSPHKLMPRDLWMQQAWEQDYKSNDCGQDQQW